MPLLFPTQGTLHDVFHPASVRIAAAPEKKVTSYAPKRTPLQAQTEHYTAWSVIEDTKKKANALSTEATKELEKASAKAQAKTGQIELYSAKYYAACTFGGSMACVSPLNH
jgi:solute carrier family 25 phosphate transporter 3